MLRGLYFSGLRFFNEPEISDSGPPKVPPGGLVLRIFTSWKSPSTSVGFEPANLRITHRIIKEILAIKIINVLLWETYTRIFIDIFNLIYSYKKSANLKICNSEHYSDATDTWKLDKNLKQQCYELRRTFNDFQPNIQSRKGLQDRNTNIIAGTTVENKGKLILTEIFPSVQKHDIF